MKKLILKDGDLAVAAGIGQTLCSYLLDEAVIVAAHDPINLMTGMVRFSFPNASMFPFSEVLNPCLFADKAVSLLLKSMVQEGANMAGLITFAFGGCSRQSHESRLGEWNSLAASEALWQHRLLVRHREVGANPIAAVQMRADSARYWVRYEDQPSSRTHRVRREPSNESESDRAALLFARCSLETHRLRHAHPTESATARAALRFARSSFEHSLSRDLRTS